jgi:RNA polymerase sigma-70 factor, ECF subfamily
LSCACLEGLPPAPKAFSWDDWAAWPAVADDPEIGRLRRVYCEAFPRAAIATFTALSPRSRLLLKQHLLDEIGPASLATLYDVHLATVSRWLDAARGELVAATRDRLARELRLDGGEVARLMALLQSELEVSLRRLLDAS